MNHNSILSQIASENNITFKNSLRFHGGDINDVFLLKGSENVVVKMNDATRFPGMFDAEAKGLKLLESSNSFRIPKVLNLGNIENHSYLLLEYIEEGTTHTDFLQKFAENLVKLHRETSEFFGLDHDNYIGSLPQQNKHTDTASEFYISERLEPQIRIAFDNGFKFKNVSDFYKNVSDEIPEEPPALIHGDLWAGNYLIDTSGMPVLIDPSVSFAPREMDLAMMKLFGGFQDSIFKSYDEQFPLVPKWQERLDIWQLYYLLVHLNLFGSGYYSQVELILKKYA